MASKTWKKWGVVLVAVTGLQACVGKAICDDVADAIGSLKDKVQACSSLGADVSVPTDSETEACAKASDVSCNADDEKLVSAATDCIAGLNACEAGKESEFQTAFQACTAPLDGLSSGCREVVKINP